jgi:hypothetical protein
VHGHKPGLRLSVREVPRYRRSGRPERQCQWPRLQGGHLAAPQIKRDDLFDFRVIGFIRSENERMLLRSCKAPTSARIPSSVTWT